MTHRFKKVYIIFLILIIAAVFLAASYLTEMQQTVPKTEVSLKENQNIFPVLYYEQDFGFWESGTHTFLLNGEEVVELEKHGRTFSRTAPFSAGAELRAKDPSAKNYGQLMVYYNSPDGEIFLFEHHKSDEFTLIKNDIKVTIPREHYESYHEFLCFGENYYLFTLLHPDNDTLRIYKLSKDFEIEKTFDIAYGKLGIPGYALVDDSFAAVNNNLFVALDNRILKYNMENGESDFIISGHTLLGIIADKNFFHAVGHEENGKYFFETFDSEGNSIKRTEKSLPFGFGYSPKFNSSSTLYMYGSEIYLRFWYEGKCYVLSFDTESEEWTNYWIAEKKAPSANSKFGRSHSYNPGNIKFVIFENGNYYDLFPFCNNSN